MSVRKPVATAAVIAAFIAGGAAGAMLLGTASAATPSPSPGATTTTPGTRGFHSNEDPAHEKGESAAREAAENNGTATYGRGHGGSTEDKTHEAGESAAREAAENSGTAGSTPSTGATAP
jgi:hypothetical protein